MAIIDALGRIATTFVAIAQTRLELAAVELEQESRRYLGYLLMALLALFLFGMALLLVALAVVIVFWDSYRLQATLGMAAVFGVAALVIGMKVRASFAAKPALMGSSVAELGKDIAFLKAGGAAHE